MAVAAAKLILQPFLLLLVDLRQCYIMFDDYKKKKKSSNMIKYYSYTEIYSFATSLLRHFPKFLSSI